MPIKTLLQKMPLAMSIFSNTKILCHSLRCIAFLKGNFKTTKRPDFVFCSSARYFATDKEGLELTQSEKSRISANDAKIIDLFLSSTQKFRNVISKADFESEKKARLRNIQSF